MPTPTLNGHFFYRESTQEWVFEVEFHIPDQLMSITRYSGDTVEEALSLFRREFLNTLNEDLG